MKVLFFPDWSAHLTAILVELDQRLRSALGVGVKLVGVERRVAKEFEGRGVNLIGAGARRDRDIRARVAALFGRRIRGSDLELLNVVRVETEDIIRRVGVGGLVGLNAVDRDVDRHGARAVHVDGIAGALHHSGFVHQEVQRIAPVERQFHDGFPFDDVADHGVGCLHGFRAGGDFHSVADRAHLQRDRKCQRSIDLDDIAVALVGAEALGFDADSVGAGRNGGERKEPRLGGGLPLYYAGGVVGQRDCGIGHGRACGVADRTGNLSGGCLGSSAERDQQQDAGDGEQAFELHWVPRTQTDDLGQLYKTRWGADAAGLKS
jgi:hypothetical protein